MASRYTVISRGDYSSSCVLQTDMYLNYLSETRREYLHVGSTFASLRK